MRAAPCHLQDLTDTKAVGAAIDLNTLQWLSLAAMRIQDMRTQERITEKLQQAFAPESLRVEDESHQHAGHAGSRPGGETHYRLYIVAEAFRGKSRLERHRMINTTLAAELAGGVHALAIHAQAPGEGL